MVARPLREAKGSIVRWARLQQMKNLKRFQAVESRSGG
jgi:hypothetical protein